MVAYWAVAAAIGVVGFTVFRVYQKRLSNNHNSFDLSFLQHVYATLFTAPISLFIIWDSVSAYSGTIPLAIAASVGANVAGTVLLFKAYELEDMSVVVPLIGVQPLGVALVEPLLFNGAHTISLVIAGAFAAVGLYVVLIDGDEYLTPVKRLRDPGPQLTLASTAIYIIAILADSYVTKHVDPLGYAFVLSGLTSIAFLIILVGKGSNLFDEPRKMVSKDLLALGLSRSMGLFGVLFAFSLTTATKVNIFMQLSPALAVLAGGTLLREPHTLRRLAGSALIVIAVVIALGGF